MTEPSAEPQFLVCCDTESIHLSSKEVVSVGFGEFAFAYKCCSITLDVAVFNCLSKHVAEYSQSQVDGSRGVSNLNSLLDPMLYAGF